MSICFLWRCDFGIQVNEAFLYPSKYTKGHNCKHKAMQEIAT